MIGEVVIYQVPGDPVAVVIPSMPDSDIVQLGISCAPEGHPFWIANQCDLPSDRSIRGAWDIDFIEAGEPSGYGGPK